MACALAPGGFRGMIRNSPIKRLMKKRCPSQKDQGFGGIPQFILLPQDWGSQRGFMLIRNYLIKENNHE
jgi:hypothetical protein